MPAYVSLPPDFLMSFGALAGRGSRSRYSHALTVPGRSSNSSEAQVIASGTPGANERMNAGRSTIHDFPHLAEKSKPPLAIRFPRNVQFPKIHGVRIFPMDYKKEVGRRIRLARDEKGWTLQELEAKTPGIDYRRINAYENGDRMPRQSEAVILAQALNKRAAWIMAIDDIQLPISSQEEALIRNWRALPERDRMEFYRSIEALALVHRDPVSDAHVEKHLPTAHETGPIAKPKAIAAKRVKKS